MEIRLVKSLASSASELLQPNSVGGRKSAKLWAVQEAKQF